MNFLKNLLRPIYYFLELYRSNFKSILKFKLKFKMKHGLSFYFDDCHRLGLYSKRFGYFSQNGQDFYLDKYVFKKKSHGVFLDIGTFDSKVDNATYFFESKRKWTGAAIEPQKAHVDHWLSQRQTPILLSAASDKIGTAKFTVVKHPQVSNFNAWSGLNDSIDQIKLSQLPIESSQFSIEVPTTTVTEVIKKFNLKNVDFISIDVEGHELSVLKGIPFNDVAIKCLVIENDSLPLGNPEIHNFLKEKGYKYIARLTSDDIFVKE